MRLKYKIVKVLNNNSLMISNGAEEVIIVGKGIGFKRSVDEIITEDIIYEKEYLLLTDKDYNFVSKSPKEIINNTGTIVDIVGLVVGKEIPEQSVRALTNHIAAMLVRFENDEIFPNPFHHATVTLYGDSYNIAEDVADRVFEEINLRIPEPEVDFLTLYINGILSATDKEDSIQINAIISEVSEALEYDLNINIDKSSVMYARLVTHLKFLIERILTSEMTINVPMTSVLREQFPEYMKMSEVIVEVIEKHLQIKLADDEHTFLALHLARLTMSDVKDLENDGER